MLDENAIRNLNEAQLARLIEYHNVKYWKEAEPEISDEEFSRRLSACAEGRKNGSTGKLETFLEGQIYDGMARGMTS